MPLFRRNTESEPVYLQAPAPMVVAPEIIYETGVTFLTNGDIHISIGSVPEAMLAVKQLKLKKKEFSPDKKVVTTELSRMRAEHQIPLGNRASMVSGGGNFGKAVRSMQHASRDISKQTYVNTLAPLERRKTAIERHVLKIDDALTQLERYILENSEV
jgi:hypothetical protein